MGAVLNEVAVKSPAAGGLPLRMRVLHIAAAPGAAWLSEAFAADRASDVALDEAVGAAAGIARLREDRYDAVLVGHQPGVLDALELVEGLRTGGAEEPFVVLGADDEAELAALCYEAGADAYLRVETTTTRALLWVVARSIEWRRLVRENRRLHEAERKRLRTEHSEAERLLDQQRALIRDLESLRSSGLADETAEDGLASEALPITEQACENCSSAAPPNLPVSLAANYRELLRAYVIMGSGNLAHEINALAESLASAGVSAPEAIQMHVYVLEELVRGLGSRSARHVMSRADLLVLEVIVHLAEGYRRRLDEFQRPLRQQTLPGFTET
ncbi:MAG TPA: response regulator [Pirellulales bacterium]|nr:response regulator [Pirellulales bacterium]